MGNCWKREIQLLLLSSTYAFNHKIYTAAVVVAGSVVVVVFFVVAVATVVAVVRSLMAVSTSAVPSNSCI